MAMAVVNGLVVLPLYMGNPAPAAASDVLTVVSFNADQRSSIRDLTFRWIDTVEPDVVVLTNVTDDWINSPEMAAPYHFLNPLPVDRTYGIAVLAREDLEVETLRITPVRDVVARVEASIGNRPLVIYAVQSPASSNETDASNRDEYFTEVASMARGETAPTVVVGDFESTSWSHTFRTLLADGDLVDSLKGYGIQTTWPADRWAFLRLPFDHLVHTADLTTVDRFTGPELGVEHRPIVVKLAPAV
jgi:endonuclease/exonuclease/phosphatase (EEP) superfamily protein YafD